MKSLLFLFVLAAMAAAQSSVSCEAGQVSSHSSENTYNAGGKGSCRIGKDPDLYRTLIRVTLGDKIPKMPCTLYCKQYSYVSSGVTYDWPSFETIISSVPGTWVNGTASEDPEEGSVCYKYRAYSAATPTYWVNGNANSTLANVIRGQGGSHVNSLGLDVQTLASGLPCTAVLDEQLLADLISGYGGLCIVRAPTGGGEMRISTSNIVLRWDPNGTPIRIEKFRMMGSSIRLLVTPNPFSANTVITYGLPGILPVKVYGMAGDLVANLSGRNGLVHWNGLDDKGYRLPNGAYIVKAGTGSMSRVERLSICR